LTGNSASFGGGAGNSTLTGCTLSNNFAILFHLEGGEGGGAGYCTLNNCVVANNSAEAVGGGAGNSTLNNCSLTGNSAAVAGGGAKSCALNNCILYDNSAPDGSNFADATESYSGCAMNYSCTAPLPVDGTGNFTNAPIFVDALAGNFHLQTSSPCINSGLNAYAPGETDLDGNARIAGGTVDVGAYELSSPSSILSYAWAQRFGLPTDGSADFADADGDGLSNWAEWHTGTDPTDVLSVLEMLSVSNSVSGTAVEWQSIAGMNYFIERSTNLAANPAFETLVTGIIADTNTTSYIDTDATNDGPYFYRVGVQ
jgi:hypothetical protein